MMLWEEALNDAQEVYIYCMPQCFSIVNRAQVINLSPSSYQGYEMRHAALHSAGRYAEVVEGFDIRLLKLKQSVNEQIRGELFPRYHPRTLRVD